MDYAYILEGRSSGRYDPLAVCTLNEWSVFRHNWGHARWTLLGKVEEDAANELCRLLWGSNPHTWNRVDAMTLELLDKVPFLMPVDDEDRRRLGLTSKYHIADCAPMPMAEGLGTRLARLRRDDAALPRE